MLRSYITTIAVSLLFVLSFSHDSKAQYCDSLVPSFNVDLSASPVMNWTSPPVQRDGSCCGAVAPDQCLEFILTFHPSVIAVNFTIASGAVPPGALFYQIDCGPPTPVGSPICLSGPGPHTLTFCKPGNNVNTFSIETFAEPIVGPDITLNAGCEGMLYAQYYNEPSIVWTSIAPGPVGMYDNLLSCDAACDSTYITAPVSGPAYIDYQVCGLDIPDCNPNPICDTVRVYLIPPVDVSILSTSTSLCDGESAVLTATVSGGTGPYNILWSTGATSSIINVSGGTFSVDVTDVSGCFVASDSITFSSNPLPTIVAGPDISVCDGEIVILSGSGAQTYQWSGGVQDGVAFTPVVGSASYILTGTDINGCVNTDQVDVTVNPLPTVDAGSDQTVCDGDQVTLSASGAQSYVWTGGVTDGVAFTPSVGTTTYTVTGIDINGCENSDQVTVTVNSLPLVDAGADETICEGETVVLTANGASNYSWTGGVIDNQSFTPGVGVQLYTVTGTDINGCVSTDDVSVTVNALPNVQAFQNTEVCFGDTVTLSAVGANSYVWDNGIVNNVPFVPSLGTTVCTVTGTDINGCVNTDQVTVLVHPNPIVYAGPDQTVCDGVYITLSADGSSNVVWSSGVVDGVPFLQAIGSVSYIVNDENSFGCTATDTVIIDVVQNPNVWVTNAEICLGEAVALIGNGADYYEWTGGIVDGAMFYPTESASYTVTGTDANGCTTDAIANIIVHYPPDVYFDILNMNLTTSDPATGFDNLTTGAVSYDWDFGDQYSSQEFEPNHEFPDDGAGEYAITLTAYSDFGCAADHTKYVHVFQDHNIYVPNAFTPDGDDYNEVFKPVMYGFDENDYVMYIYNRWGELIFETHNMEVGWDGTYAGQDYKVQDGVFTWKIEARIKGSTDHKIYMGHVSIIK
jgi:gliding motility-associated-like protein